MQIPRAFLPFIDWERVHGFAALRFSAALFILLRETGIDCGGYYFFRIVIRIYFQFTAFRGVIIPLSKSVLYTFQSGDCSIVSG